MGDSDDVERDRIAGPVIVRNIFPGRRVWPDLTTLAGSTLDLDAGEETLLPADPGDVAYLHIRKATKAAQESLQSTDENTGG